MLATGLVCDEKVDLNGFVPLTKFVRELHFKIP